MSTYAVFGMTPHMAYEEAKRTTATTVSEKEWIERVRKRADELMASGKVVQLSDKFDAPQFAEEFLELARKGGGRSLSVRRYAQVGTNQKTMRPKFAWESA
jgi:hypothetical protein